MPKSPLVVLVAIAILMATLVQSTRATMIVVIYVPDGFWLGSDSYRSSGGEHIANVCKIHETRFGLLAKAGESQGTMETGEVYSTDKEVEDALVANGDPDSFQSSLRFQFKRDIEAELAFLDDEPTVTSQNLELFRMRQPIPKPLIPMLSRTVIMFDTRSPDAAGKILLVIPQSDEITDPQFGTYYKYWAPSFWGWHPLDGVTEQPNPTVSSVHEFAYSVSYGKTDAWIQKHPEQAIKEILKQAHSEQPKDIGPPYSIVHVISRKPDLPNVKWVAKGKCPGWSDRVYNKNPLLELRDKLKKESSDNR